MQHSNATNNTNLYQTQCIITTISSQPHAFPPRLPGLLSQYHACLSPLPSTATIPSSDSPPSPSSSHFLHTLYTNHMTQGYS